jgi:hypothetical protein
MLVATLIATGPVHAQVAPVVAGESTHQTNKPDVPCASLDEKERRRTERCKTDEERREDDLAKREKERAERERPTKTSLLTWIHTDALWTESSSGASMFGIVGVHLAVANVGRVYFFGPPGVMLVSEETPDGRTWRGRFTWGVGFHLFDFRAPSTSRRARLFLNVAKVWSGTDYRTGADMVGLSVSWKEK